MERLGILVKYGLTEEQLEELQQEVVENIYFEFDRALEQYMELLKDVNFEAEVEVELEGIDKERTQELFKELLWDYLKEKSNEEILKDLLDKFGPAS